MYDTAQPYLAAYCLLRKGNKLCFVLRSNTGWMDGHYGIPAGKVEHDEKGSLAAAREALEEVGVKIKQNDLRIAHVCHRKSDDATRAWIDLLFEVDAREGEPINAEPKSHSEVAWLDQDNLPDNVIPAVKHYIEQIKSGAFYSEYGW